MLSSFYLLAIFHLFQHTLVSAYTHKQVDTIQGPVSSHALQQMGNAVLCLSVCIVCRLLDSVSPEAFLDVVMSDSKL